MIELRRLDRANLTEAYGVASERLLPWATLNAPFEGAWCVLRPGDISSPHSHHEYELFIAMTGRATIEIDGVRREFVAGDLTHLRPGSIHHVHNDSDADFEWYALWWDAAMSLTFVARHAVSSDDAQEGPVRR